MNVMERIQDHLNEIQEVYPYKTVGIFLQGSQNYGLDIEGSDVDTKLVICPEFKDIAMNKKAISTTYIRQNDEHTDIKDIRLMIQTFKKQNINFMEILFTDYSIVSPKYQEQWNRLREAREKIARYYPYQAVKTMKGMAMEKYHALEHPYPSKLDVLAVYGYDPKQLHHLIRINEFVRRYIDGELYENCLRPRDPEFLKDVKRGLFTLGEARSVATSAMNVLTQVADEFCESVNRFAVDTEVGELLDDVQYQIMKESVKEELQ